MIEGQANEALEKLNQGIQESRQMVQQRTMELARDYFVDSMEALKREIEDSKSTLEDLPDQIPGGREESFQMLFQELMGSYSLVEDSLAETQESVSNLDTEQLRRQGEIDASDAARREAQELGIDLTEVEGTGTGGRIIVSDVVEAAQEATRHKAVELGVDLSQIEGTGAGGLKTVRDVIEASGQMGEAAELAGPAAQETQSADGQATEQAGQETAEQVAQGAGDAENQASDQAGQIAQRGDGAAGQAVGGVSDAADGAADQLTGQAAEASSGAEEAGEAASGNGAGAGQVKATTAARHKAEELGVDLSQIEGTGAEGRITIKDVVGAADQQ